MRFFSQLPRQARQAVIALSLVFISYSLLLVVGIHKHQARLISGKSPLQTLISQSLTQNTQSDTDGKVLGARTPEVYVYAGDNSFSSGGLITMSSLAEPVMEVSTYNAYGKYNITVYQTSVDPILNYLQYTDEFKQKNSTVDTSGMTQIASFEQEILGNSEDSRRIVLPIGNIGQYYVRLQKDDIIVNTFVVRSDFGAVAKEGDNELLIWTQDFPTTRKLPGVTYTAYSMHNGTNQLYSGQTNDDGIAKMAVANPADLAVLRKDDRVAILPINLKYLSQWSGNLENRYYDFELKKRSTKMFTFTDRPLYRPGDKIYFKSILRDDDDARYSIPTGTARVKVSQGYQDDETVIYDKQVGISAEGTVDGEVVIPEDIKTGFYQLTVSINDRLTSYQYFSIEHFRKPEYIVDADTQILEYINGDEIQFQVKGNYFSGQPLSKKEVTYSIHTGNYYDYAYIDPTSFSDDYRYSRYWDGYKEVERGTAILDEKGNAIITHTTQNDDGKSSRVYTLEVSYEDESGNPSFDSKNVLVYNGEYGIYRQDHSWSNKVNLPAELKLKLKAHTPKATLANLPFDIDVKRTSWISYQEQDKKYPSYRKEEETFAPLKAQSDQDGNVLLRFTPPKSGHYTFTIKGKDQRGNSIIRETFMYASDENGIYYRGDYGYDEDSTLSVQVDKDQYEPNGTIEASITSYYPFRDVLLSFDRNRVNRYQVVSLQATNTTVQLPVEATDAPNIFLSVMGFAGNDLDRAVAEVTINTDNKKMIVNITPDRKEYGPGDQVTLNVSTTDTKGNPISGDLAVWSVDKAIFELVEQQSLEIFDTFWEKRYLNTEYTHTLQSITVVAAEGGGGCFAPGTLITMFNGSQKKIEDIQPGDVILTRESDRSNQLTQATVKQLFKQRSAGYLIVNQNLRLTPEHVLWINGQWLSANHIALGDQLWNAEGQLVTVESLEWQHAAGDVYNLETTGNHTFLANGYWVHNQKDAGARSVFKDTAYWNPHVQTDNNGRAQVSFKLPDNLTTWVIAGVGATRDTVVGNTTQEIMVSKDVVIRPILPNLLQKDDPTLIEALVHNFSDKQQEFDVSLKFDSGDIWPIETTKVTVPANDVQSVKWNVVPRKENETSKMTFSAKAQSGSKDSDIVEQTIKIIQYSFAEDVGQTGIGNVSFGIKVPEHLDQEKSSVTIQLASSIIGTIPKAIEYLIDYPYGCVEQTTSRFVPTVIAARNSALFKEALAGKDIKKMIDRGVIRLDDHQQQDGGWGWWAHNQSDPFISAYVTEYLLKAQQAGYDVDDALLTRSKYYFEYLSAQYNTPEYVMKSYALALLNSDKKYQITEFQNMQSDILAYAVMSNIIQGNQDPQKNGMAVLSAQAKSEGNQVFWERGQSARFGSNEASTALAVRALIMGKSDAAMINAAMLYLTQQRKSYYWGNTFAAAQIIQAVSDFSSLNNETNPNFTYEITLDGVMISRGNVTSSNQIIKPIPVPFNLIKTDGTSQLEMKKIGDGELYSTVIQKHIIVDKHAPAVEHGMKLTRRYLNDQNEEVIPAVGDYVNVELTLSGLTTDENYGVVQDTLPAGMIPVNFRFDNQQGTWPKDWNDYNAVETTENGVILSMHSLYPGSKTVRYRARVISQGEFIVPPATASLMYNPEVYARTGAQQVKIGTEAIIIPPTNQQESNRAQKIMHDWQLIALLSILLIFFIVTFALQYRKQKKMKQHTESPIESDEL